MVKFTAPKKISKLPFIYICRVNCNFYFKIGACRHGDKCNRIHNKPTISQTILFKHLYQNPLPAISIAEGNKVSNEAVQEAVKHFQEFYEEIFLELMKYGELLELNVCDNLGDHLIGNVYAKFNSEQEAEKAFKALNGKYYNDRQVVAEYSPVTNFRECRCRQYEEGSCGRGGFCNFMHLKNVSRKIKNSLIEQMYSEYPEYKEQHKRHHDRSRDRSEERRKKRHRHSSSESSLEDRNSEERRRIIEGWNIKYERKKEEERKKREAAEAKINLKLFEQKFAQSKAQLGRNKKYYYDDDYRFDNSLDDKVNK